MDDEMKCSTKTKKNLSWNQKKFYLKANRHAFSVDLIFFSFVESKMKLWHKSKCL